MSGSCCSGLWDPACLDPAPFFGSPEKSFELFRDIEGRTSDILGTLGSRSADAGPAGRDQPMELRWLLMTWL